MENANKQGNKVPPDTPSSKRINKQSDKGKDGKGTAGSLLPRKYLPKSLTKKDAEKQSSDIKKTALKVKQNKQNLGKDLKREPKVLFKPLKKEDFERPKVDYPYKRSPYVKQFEDKYNMKVSIDDISDKFNIPKTALKQIYDKGVGAFLSSGSRPNVNAYQWGYARIASVLLGGKSRKIDNHIVEKYNLPLL